MQCSNGSIKPPVAYLSETILRLGAYSSGGAYLSGGLIKFRAPQVYQRQYLVLLSNVEYFDVNVDRDGIK